MTVYQIVLNQLITDRKILSQNLLEGEITTTDYMEGMKIYATIE